MSSDIAISVTNVGKCYLVYEKPVHRLLQMLWRGRRKFYREFWAVRNVSFTIAKGQTVGIIGRNGAGKSTLLQMICGTVDQTEGEIDVNGKVAALLELGAGFNPEFTGRENVYLSCALYGLTKPEVDSRLQAIFAFADIGAYIDQPVKVYSTGMFVRLAFAVIAHVDAEILVVDEALSVGDAYFQQKCLRFLAAFQSSGGTLLFVSHDMGTVTALCESALLLRSAEDRYLCEAGTAREIAAVYLHDMQDERARELPRDTVTLSASAVTECESGQVPGRSAYRSEGSATTYHVSGMRENPDSFGASGGRILDVAFRDDSGEPIAQFQSGVAVQLTVRAQTLRAMRYPAIGFMLKDRKGQYVIAESTDSYFRQDAIAIDAGTELVAMFRMSLPPLVRGTYSLDVAFAEGPGEQHVQQHWIHDVLQVTAINDKLVHGVSGAVALTVSLDVVTESRRGRAE